MSFLAPGPLAAYSPLESSNLKIAVTPLPVAFSARVAGGPVTLAAPGAYAAPNSPYSTAGLYLRTSFNDWYYRLHVIPTQLALGNLSGDTQRTVTIWNAFFDPVSLSDFSVLGEGITVSSTVLPPQDIPPLEDVRYVFSISAAGPSVIKGSATWTIDGVEYLVPITGLRTVLFGFKPNWNTAVVETLEWKNTLTTSFSGVEQVMRIRQEPRRQIEYSLRLRDNDTRLFDLSVFGWTGRVFGVPLWHEKTKLQQAAAQGSSTLFLDTTMSSFESGGSAVLFNDAHDFEILDLGGVSAGTLSLNNSLSREWLTGSHVVPVMAGVPGTELTTARAVPQHVDAAVRFLLTPQEAALRLVDLPPADTYRDFEMYTGETNWKAALSLTIEARRVEVGNDGLGAIRIAPKTDFPLVTRSFAWLLKSRELAEELRGFFVRRQGRRFPAWMPSGTEDFVLVSQSELGETALRVQKSSYNTLIANNPAKRDIVIMMRNGDRLARRILAVEDDGADSVITVNAGMPYVVNPDNVKRISFLGLYRMASDAVSFVWRSDRIAEVQCDFVLKKEPRE